MDLSQHAIIPVEDFRELQATAYNVIPKTVPDRIAGTVQTTIVCSVLAGAFVGCSWGVAKAMDWFEQKNFDRKIAERKSFDTP